MGTRKHPLPAESRTSAQAKGTYCYGMLIRRETMSDAEAIRAVHTVAFSSAYENGRPPEPRLVDELRHSPAWIDQLAFVAVVDGRVVGHVCCTRALLLPSEDPVLGLGPIGVLPDKQHDGIGSALMHTVIGAADARDEPLIALLGDPEYYQRFGFVPAVDLGITPPVAEWASAFVARKLAMYDPALTGEFQYAEPFDNL
jgi:putative acetyltransferase